VTRDDHRQRRTTSVPVNLTIFGGSLRAMIPVPADDTTPVEMIPIFEELTGAIVHLSEKDVDRSGKSISCRAGCGACCRQYVPLSQTEARRLIRLVDSMPEPRRTEIRRRFAAAVERIDHEGLRDRLMNQQDLPRERLTSLGFEYFRMGLPCPFLEDESCSIHHDRPVTCREYLVTSPAENCSRLEDIDGVRMPYRPSIALCLLDERPDDRYLRTVPLTLIFEWAKTAPPPPEPRPGDEIMRDFLANLEKTLR
jgi:Fe-S-cluster containining protein